MSIKLPNGITSIGHRAFIDCFSLAYFKIPEKVTSIETGAFSGCCSLDYIEIPQNVTNIGDYAFENCANLSCVLISNTVTKIGKGVFTGCNGLKEVHSRINNIDFITEEVFPKHIYEECVLFVPVESFMKYLRHPIFGRFQYIKIE